jgi:Lon protease-like protein
MEEFEIPLFPLRTVLFPGGPLPLRVFEQRYLGLISRCLREESTFGVALIREGDETGRASIYEVGTLARIVDWYQGSDGLLGVTAQGEDKFGLLESWREEDGLNIGRVQRLPPEQAIALPPEHAPLSGLLQDVLDDLGIHYQQLPKSYGDAAWVGHRLSEILPISLEQKQYCLELDDPLHRLAALSPVLKELQENG